LGEAPFFVLNCDAIIPDGDRPALTRLAEAWDPHNQDVLMLLQPRERAHGFDGAGDFFLRPDGGLIRRGTAPAAPFVYAGAYIMHPRILAGEATAPFSMNRIWDRAIKAGRMHGLVHDGDWYHVGTPEAVGETERLLGFREPAIS
jgi:MurNAc alpha-1-phosphate uridylyltransferase